MQQQELDNLERHSGLPENPERTTTVATVIIGAAIGALIGFWVVVGYVGALIGAVIGAAAGFAIAVYMRGRWKRERERDEVLDREIGVIGGDLGPSPR